MAVPSNVATAPGIWHVLVPYLAPQLSVVDPNRNVEANVTMGMGNAEVGRVLIEKWRWLLRRLCTRSIRRTRTKDGERRMGPDFCPSLE